MTRPFAKIGQIRSAGITDLRYGHVLPTHGADGDRFEAGPDTRPLLPLPAGVPCFALAATLAAASADLSGPAQLKGKLAQTLGDGLVPLSSALGQHAEAERSLDFPLDAQWIAFETGHVALLHSPAVYAQIRRWLA